MQKLTGYCKDLTFTRDEDIVEYHGLTQVKWHTLTAVLRRDYREQGQKQKTQRGGYCSNPERDQDGSQGGDKKKRDSAYILKVKSTEFSDRLAVGCETEQPYIYWKK